MSPSTSAAVGLLHVPTGGPVCAGGCGAGTRMRGDHRGSPGSGSGVEGVVRWTVLAPRRMPVAGVTVPAPGARSRRGRVAARPAPCADGRPLPCVGAGCWGQCQDPAAPGTPQGAGRCRVVVPGPVVPRASIPGPGAASADRAHGSPGVAASCGQGGACVSGGGRSPGRQGPRVGTQQPNKGLQATPKSLRSCVASALGRA